MKTTIIVDKNNNPIEKRDISFGHVIPRVGESLSVVRYVEGNAKFVDGVRTGIEYLSVVDKIDKYKVIDIEHVITPTVNNSTNIDVKIIVSLIA